MDHSGMVEECLAKRDRLNAWEQDFIDSIADRLDQWDELTERQADVLKRIWETVTGSKYTRLRVECSDDLSGDQREALQQLHQFAAGSQPLLALSGAAGTGKTFLMRQFSAETNELVIFTATTHKAARVLSRTCGAETMTIHHLLGLSVRWIDGRRRLVQSRKIPLPERSIVVVDEASMIDLDLLHWIESTVTRYGARALLIGDQYQLPPVSPDVLTPVPPVFWWVPTISLTTIHRQAKGSPILSLAARIRAAVDGEPLPIVRAEGDAIVRLPSSPETGHLLSRLFSSREEAEDVRLLAWTNDRVTLFNTQIRKRIFGPSADQSPYLVGEYLTVNSPVMRSGVAVLGNEETVKVLEVTPGSGLGGLRGYRLILEKENEQQVSVFAADDPRERWTILKRLEKEVSRAQGLYRVLPEGSQEAKRMKKAVKEATDAVDAFEAEVADLRPTYAQTVHKSQGSTYKVAVLDLTDIGRAPELARLLYVAVTRAKDRIYLLGALA